MSTKEANVQSRLHHSFIPLFLFSLPLLSLRLSLFFPDFCADAADFNPFEEGNISSFSVSPSPPRPSCSLTRKGVLASQPANCSQAHGTDRLNAFPKIEAKEAGPFFTFAAYCRCSASDLCGVKRMKGSVKQRKTSKFKKELIY